MLTTHGGHGIRGGSREVGGTGLPHRLWQAFLVAFAERLRDAREFTSMTDHDRYDDQFIRDILEQVKTIAVVGASDNPARDSHEVTAYLVSKGYKVFAINPKASGSIAGAPVYARLADVPERIDMVDVFRNNAAVPGVVDEMLALDPLPAVLWMQLGVRVDEAAARAEERGVKVVMNRCPKIEYPRLMARS